MWSILESGHCPHSVRTWLRITDLSRAAVVRSVLRAASQASACSPKRIFPAVGETYPPRDLADSISARKALASRFVAKVLAHCLPEGSRQFARNLSPDVFETNPITQPRSRR